MSYLHTIPASMSYAWAGLKTAFAKEPNFRVHVISAVVVIAVGLFLGLSTVEWAILAITIALVIILELANTSLEAIVNMVSPQMRPEAKIAKDTAAAAVLLAAIAAVVEGFLIFLPKIF